jgi:hypothetical protein
MILSLQLNRTNASRLQSKATNPAWLTRILRHPGIVTMTSRVVKQQGEGARCRKANCQELMV